MKDGMRGGDYVSREDFVGRFMRNFTESGGVGLVRQMIDCKMNHAHQFEADSQCYSIIQQPWDYFFDRITNFGRNCAPDKGHIHSDLDQMQRTDCDDSEWNCEFAESFDLYYCRHVLGVREYIPSHVQLNSAITTRIKFAGMLIENVLVPMMGQHPITSYDQINNIVSRNDTLEEENRALKRSLAEMQQEQQHVGNVLSNSNPILYDHKVLQSELRKAEEDAVSIQGRYLELQHSVYHAMREDDFHKRLMTNEMYALEESYRQSQEDNGALRSQLHCLRENMTQTVDDEVVRQIKMRIAKKTTSLASASQSEAKQQSEPKETDLDYDYVTFGDESLPATLDIFQSNPWVPIVETHHPLLSRIDENKFKNKNRFKNFEIMMGDIEKKLRDNTITMSLVRAIRDASCRPDSPWKQPLFNTVGDQDCKKQRAGIMNDLCTLLANEWQMIQVAMKQAKS